MTKGTGKKRKPSPTSTTGSTAQEPSGGSISMDSIEISTGDNTNSNQVHPAHQPPPVSNSYNHHDDEDDDDDYYDEDYPPGKKQTKSLLKDDHVVNINPRLSVASTSSSTTPPADPSAAPISASPPSMGAPTHSSDTRGILNQSSGCDSDQVKIDGRFQTYVWWSLAVSWVLVIGTGIGGFFCFVYSWIVDSSALLTFSIEALIDMFASILVLWRFMKIKKTDVMMSDLKIDQRAGVVIACLFVVTNVISAFVAIANLADEDAPDDPETLRAIMIAAFLLLLGLGSAQIYLAMKTGSIPLKLDGFSSVAGSGVALAIVISSSVYDDHPSVWWIDAAAGLIISIVMISLGVYNLYKIKGWYRRDFWRES